jgi:hypothetical protein
MAFFWFFFFGLMGGSWSEGLGDHEKTGKREHLISKVVRNTGYLKFFVFAGNPYYFRGLNIFYAF